MTDIQRIKIQELTILNHSNTTSNTTSSGSMHTGDKRRRLSDTDHTTDHTGHHNYDPYYDSDDENDRPLYNMNNNNHHNLNNNSSNSNSNSVEHVIDTDTSKNLRAARTFECEARGSLVDRCCKAGDLVNIVGIIKTNNVSIHRVYVYKYKYMKCCTIYCHSHTVYIHCMYTLCAKFAQSRA